MKHFYGNERNAMASKCRTHKNISQSWISCQKPEPQKHDQKLRKPKHVPNFQTSDQARERKTAPQQEITKFSDRNGTSAYLAGPFFLPSRKLYRRLGRRPHGNTCHDSSTTLARSGCPSENLRFLFCLKRTRASLDPVSSRGPLPTSSPVRKISSRHRYQVPL
jgi:hypothetical protein